MGMRGQRLSGLRQKQWRPKGQGHMGWRLSSQSLRGRRPRGGLEAEGWEAKGLKA